MSILLNLYHFSIFLFIFGILIVVHEFGHFIAAKRTGVRVEKFSVGLGRPLFKKRKGDTEYCLSAVPFGGFVKLAGDSLEECVGKPDEYLAQSPGKRFWIIFSGPVLNYILAFLVFWAIFFTGLPVLTTKIGALLDDYGAKAAGLEPGDKILAVDGKEVRFFEDLQKFVQDKKEAETVELLVSRGREEFKREVMVRQKEVQDHLGKKHSIGLIGIVPADEVVIVRHGPLESIALGAKRTWDLTILTYKGLWGMITGKLSIRESMTGPLGIYDITSKAARRGVSAVLHLVAVLSLSLAIFNLLPLPILDGGHILFLGLEKLRGKALGVTAERLITRIGVSLIIFLAVFISYNDIMRLFGDKISKLFR
ncbi:MAG: RIP metalloprotease RseP [Candidatus Omnitrophica bacterium]|nr:RIP metalloprotease RseP [Candidatus Omnitrophota bacterium]